MKNKFMRIASVLLVAVILSTCVISGTFAKYTNTSEGSDSARIAKWDIKLEGNKMSDSTSFTFDLFNTIMDSDGANAETDVSNKTDDGKTVIAPGTSGSFEINLDNDSEVSAKYSIDYTLTNSANIPVEFSVDGTHWYSDINYLDVTGVALAMSETDPANTATIVVQWHWIFEQGADSADTDLGIMSTLPELSVAAEITVEQVD